LRGKRVGAREHGESVFLADAVKIGNSLQHFVPPETFLREGCIAIPSPRAHPYSAINREIAMPTTAEKRQVFRKLHDSGCWVIPNPLDIGSARYLQGMVCKAWASTSAGYAFAQGLPDAAVDRDLMLNHLREL